MPSTTELSISKLEELTCLEPVIYVPLLDLSSFLDPDIAVAALFSSPTMLPVKLWDNEVFSKLSPFFN